MWAVTGWIVGVLCRHDQKGYLIKKDRVAETERPTPQMSDMQVQVLHRSHFIAGFGKIGRRVYAAFFSLSFTIKYTNT